MARMDEPPLNKAQQAARERGALDVLKRVEQAKQVALELQERRIASKDKRQQKSQAKASTTDSQARIMRMPDGGFAPAYNLQLSTIGSPMGGPAAVIAIRVVNLGTDKGSLLPMYDQACARTGHTIHSVLVDSDHLTHQEIRQADTQKLQVISTVPDKWSRMADPLIQSWADSVQTQESKTRYRVRKSLVERVNAILKGTFRLTFRLRQVPVRGRGYVQSSIPNFCTLACLTLNIVQFGQFLV